MAPGSDYHRPVMVAAVLNFLQPEKGGWFIDATCGGGGHTEAILEGSRGAARVLAIDRDRDAIEYTRERLRDYGDKVSVLKGTFGQLKDLSEQAGAKSIKGVLFDLGISSHQIDQADRGFSYRASGPLDLRMDREMDLTAAEVVNTYPTEELARLFFEYGEEKNSRKIAAAIDKARRKSRIDTTGQLADVITGVTNPRWVNKTLSRVFQALRLEINEEMEQLETGMRQAVEILDPGGRMVVISYHSLEDRRVKLFLRASAKSDGKIAILTKKPLVPERDEIASNPRARSARLRAGEKRS